MTPLRKCAALALAAAVLRSVPAGGALLEDEGAPSPGYESFSAATELTLTELGRADRGSIADAAESEPQAEEPEQGPAGTMEEVALPEEEEDSELKSLIAKAESELSEVEEPISPVASVEMASLSKGEEPDKGPTVTAHAFLARVDKAQLAHPPQDGGSSEDYEQVTPSRPPHAAKKRPHVALFQMSGKTFLYLGVVLILVILMAGLGYLVHNNWNVQAAADEAKDHAKRASLHAKKATNAAAGFVYEKTLPKDPAQKTDAGAASSKEAPQQRSKEAPCCSQPC